MARLNRLMMGNRDTPLTARILVPSATAGTGTDYEKVLFTLPDLSKIILPPLAAGAVGDLPINSLYLRDVVLVTEAALTGQATNYFQWLVRQYRAGAVLAQYALASASAITVGANTIVVTQAAGQLPLQNVRAGQIINISGGVGTAEFTTITSVSIPNGTITFTAANTHSGAYTIACQDLIDPLIYSSAPVTEAAYTPHQVNTLPNYIKAGDVITFQRQSFGTGLASPALTVQLEFMAVKNSPATGLWMPLG